MVPRFRRFENIDGCGDYEDPLFAPICSHVNGFEMSNSILMAPMHYILLVIYFFYSSTPLI